MITRMRFTSFTVTDLNMATDFYVGKLGFRVQVEMPLPGNNQFVMLAPPGSGSSIVFSLPLPGQEHKPITSIAFEAENVYATYAELCAIGVEFLRPPTKTPWGGVEAAFTDPFGNRFLLQQGGL